MPNLTELLSFINSIEFNSSELHAKLLFLKIPFLIVGFLLFSMIVYTIVKSSWIRFSIFADVREFFAYRPYGFPKVGRKWRRIMARLETGNEAEYKLCIMEADAMLDELLKNMKIGGKTIEDRLLMLNRIVIPNIEELRNSHRVRNNIVYDPDYRLTLAEARRTLEEYEKAFRTLDLL